MKKATKKSLLLYIRYKLQTDTKWMEAGIISMFNQQTLSEREHELSMFRNGAGFDFIDDKKFSTMAKRLKQGLKVPDTVYKVVKERIHRYATQLYSLSDKDKLLRGYYKYTEEQDRLKKAKHLFVQPSLDLGLSESFNRME